MEIVDLPSLSEKETDTISFSLELRRIARLGWPNSVNNVLTFLPGLCMLYFLEENIEEAAAAGMGFMFCNVTGFSLIIGSGAGATPLISQAFGARNFLRCGELLQKQLAIHSALCVFITFIWMNSEHVLLVLRQPSNIASLAGQFVRWRVAALPALALKEDITNFFVAQQVMQMPMLASIIASIMNLFAFAILIPRVGFIGAPLSFTLANILQALLLTLWGRSAVPDASAWPRWNLKSACSGWGEMLKLALPGGILMLCEWWGWEINLFFAGLLCKDAITGCVDLDVFPIAANTMVLAFMPNYGFATAAGTLIGNALGANEPHRAKYLSKLCLGIATIIGGSIALVLTFLRRPYAGLFSNDAAIVELTIQVLPVIGAYIFLDCLGPGSLIPILRSMNVVTLPAIFNFLAFYVVGIPFGIFLAFGLPRDHWGIIGLWLGLVLAMLTLVLSLLLFLLGFVDWQQNASLAHDAATQRDRKPESDIVSMTPTLDSNVLGKQSYSMVSNNDDCIVALPCPASMDDISETSKKVRSHLQSAPVSAGA